MSSIASTRQSCSSNTSYGEAQDWIRCFERLGHGELSPDQAIQESSKGAPLGILQLGLLTLRSGLWILIMGCGCWALEFGL